MVEFAEHKKFSWSRVFTVAQRVLKQFLRDHRTFAMMVIFPILFMLVFGVVLSGEVKHVPIAIDNQDIGLNSIKVIGQEIYDQMLTDDHVEIINETYSDAVDMVERANLIAAIQFPENFTRDLIFMKNTTIIVYMDGTKPQLRATVYRAISDAMSEIMEGQGMGGLNIEEHLAFGVGELSGLDVAIPAVMGYILTFIILLIAVLTAIREDISGTKLRLFTTPLTPVEKILGYLIALSFFAILETSVAIAIAIFLFGSVVQGSISLLFLAGFLYGISHILLAFFLSNFAKNEFQSVQLAVLIAIPSLALSGIMIPITTFPPWLRVVSNFIPLTYGIRTFEGIMLRGWGLKELWFEFTLITVLAVIFFILSLISSSDKSKD